jgi:hypothetical protein
MFQLAHDQDVLYMFYDPCDGADRDKDHAGWYSHEESVFVYSRSMSLGANCSVAVANLSSVRLCRLRLLASYLMKPRVIVGEVASTKIEAERLSPWRGK